MVPSAVKARMAESTASVFCEPFGRAAAINSDSGNCATARSRPCEPFAVTTASGRSNRKASIFPLLERGHDRQVVPVDLHGRARSNQRAETMPTKVVPRTTPHRSRRAVSRSETFVPLRTTTVGGVSRYGVEKSSDSARLLVGVIRSSARSAPSSCPATIRWKLSVSTRRAWSPKSLSQQPGQFVLEPPGHSARRAFPEPGTRDVSSHHRERAGGSGSERARRRRRGPVAASRHHGNG